MEKKKKTLETILAQKLQDAWSPRLKGKRMFNPKRVHRTTNENYI